MFAILKLVELINNYVQAILEKELSFCYVWYLKEIYFRMWLRNVASVYKMGGYYSQEMKVLQNNLLFSGV